MKEKPNCCILCGLRQGKYACSVMNLPCKNVNAELCRIMQKVYEIAYEKGHEDSRMECKIELAEGENIF